MFFRTIDIGYLARRKVASLFMNTGYAIIVRSFRPVIIKRDATLALSKIPKEVGSGYTETTVDQGNILVFHVK